MCLDKIDWNRKNSKACYKNSFKKKDFGIGYKVFGKDALKGYFSPHYGSDFYILNKWYTNLYNAPIETGYGNSPCYNSGYHIFRTYASAKLWCDKSFNRSIVVEVEYANVVAEGYQWPGFVVIAQKMKLIMEVSKQSWLEQSW